MVVVHVGDDHVLHGGRIDAERRQTIADRGDQLAPALRGDLDVESGIDNEGPCFAAG
jgi:hypothetical protein